MSENKKNEISVEDKINLLLKVPLFKSLESEKILSLANALIECKIKKNNDVVFNEEDEEYALYIIYKGQVQINKGMRGIDGMLSPDDVRYITIGYKNEGDYFGEMSLLDKKARSASILATRKTKLLKLTREKFKEIISPENHDSIIIELLANLRKTDKRLTNLALMSSYQKVAMIIYENFLAGADTNKIELNNKKISELLAINLKDVGAFVKALVDKGFIERIGYKEIKIVKKEFPHTKKELENNDV